MDKQRQPENTARSETIRSEQRLAQRIKTARVWNCSVDITKGKVVVGTVRKLALMKSANNNKKWPHETFSKI
jgi:hypothetical protein